MKTNDEILAELDARLKAVEGNQSPEEQINSALASIRDAMRKLFPEPMRETALANTKLDECAMWLNAAMSVKKVQEDASEHDSDSEVLPPVPVPAESLDAEEEREV